MWTRVYYFSADVIVVGLDGQYSKYLKSKMLKIPSVKVSALWCFLAGFLSFPTKCHPAFMMPGILFYFYILDIFIGSIFCYRFIALTGLYLNEDLYAHFFFRRF